MGSAVGKISSETPAHEVVKRTDEYEIWRYPASVAAVVYASDLAKEGEDAPTGKAFSSAAFGTLARYIGVFSTPQNTAAAGTAPEKVAMTAPVVQAAPEKIAATAAVVLSAPLPCNGECMKFLLPAKYRSIEEAPVPTNPAVKLEMVEGGRVEAVLPFSGDLNMKVSAKKAKELLQMLKRDQVAPHGEWTTQGYNPPYTLPHLKRNEIHVPLDPSKYPAEVGAA